LHVNVFLAKLIELLVFLCGACYTLIFSFVINLFWYFSSWNMLQVVFFEKRVASWFTVRETWCMLIFLHEPNCRWIFFPETCCMLILLFGKTVVFLVLLNETCALLLLHETCFRSNFDYETSGMTYGMLILFFFVKLVVCWFFVHETCCMLIFFFVKRNVSWFLAVVKHIAFFLLAKFTSFPQVFALEA